MKFDLKKILFAFLVLFVGLGCVSAAEVNDSALADMDTPTFNEESVSVIGGFEDLETDIANLTPGSVYDVNQDYIFDFDGLDIGHGGIVINVDNVTINGNGHVIDGNFKSALFKVTGNNVKILNLTFINSQYNGLNFPVRTEHGLDFDRLVVKYTYDMSPVYWSGDDGLISDCIFSSCQAINGGVVTWMGDNGVINNTQFIDNQASGIAGAVHLGGNNNTISNCIFVNSTSALSGEAIYIDRKHGHFTFNNLMFNQDIWIVDGSFYGIDADYLKYAYYSQVGDKWINLLPLLYKTIINGGVAYYNNETYCVSRNDIFDSNNSIFTFSVISEFNDDGIVYEKDYIFFNNTIGEVFESLFDDNYLNTFTVVKNVNVTDIKSYEDICRSNIDNLVFDTDSMKDIIKYDISKHGAISFTSCLNVTFAPGCVFNSNSAFNVVNYFDIVNINGNGARIKASTDEDDEFTWIENTCQACSISNLTIEGFNHGIFNYGICILDGVNFENNHIVFTFESKDWGAAILNVGTCICYGCVFSNNVANSGGAIYNQGVLTVENCSFYSNEVRPTFFNTIGVTTGGIGIDICNLKGVGKVYSPLTMDYDEVSGFDVLETTITSTATLVLSFATGVAIGYCSGSIKIGAIAGATAGACIGAIGSLIVCHNTMDVTFNSLRFSLLLICGSIIEGAIGGIVGDAAAKIAADNVNREQNIVKLLEFNPI